LLGRSGADGALQWALATAATGGNWSGPAESGIDEAVDALVRSAHDIESEPLADVNCHISGVSDLNAFAAVLDIVAATPGVTDVAVQNVDADGLSLRLHARASGESLARALAGERLKAVSESGGALEYRYQASP
jgi:hypothetical protein